MLFAAILVGCSTKAQTRSASQPTPQAAQAPAAESAYEPPAYEDPVVSTPQAEETAAAPKAVKDDGDAQVAAEGVAQPEVFGEEAAEAKPEDEPQPQQFTDQAGPVAEEEPSAQQPFVDEEPAAPDEEVAQQQFTDDDASAMDEDVAQQQFTDDAAPEKDEAVAQEQFTDDAAPEKDEAVAQEQFTDDAAPEKDEAVAQEQFTDDAAPEKDEAVAQEQFAEEAPTAKDEEIVAQQQFTDEAAPATEDVTAPEVFKDDTAEAAPEELAREPETLTEEKVAQAEEPKAPPVTMLPVTVTVEADPLFDFGKYAIRADARSKLDELVQQLEGVTYGEVIAVGFADPIGTGKYNKGLSERRAASVKRYLVSKGIPADRIKAEGRGRTEEFASLKNCHGQRKQKLIACLEPNRRVEVTVTAEKQQ
jgi:outer membrane protein OmpA-like peptidoglycan-associated protein